MPLFDRDETIDWLRKIHEYPCDWPGLLYAEGRLGHASFSWNKDVDCTIVGPRTPEGGYDRFIAALFDPAFHFGVPGGTRSGFVIIYSPSGVELGNLGFNGACIGSDGCW
ncbi:hypothetical protein BDW02DRAFT_574839 [Decorospora gaudefroyi]|uniref:Uncharacterized protein n=1 Tax=Decorospora gaudefroyi TaxID=184978 RepID=A0A6A5JX31_9PLEO|nr:hypothetical protein BDW02DRAFT_574839 [Decorospora gaudefroyi]